MSKDMQKKMDAAKKKKLPLPPITQWVIHGACLDCGSAIHECECK
jgi:hypothetical protein